MFENKTEQQAREEILTAVKAYCDTFHNKKEPFKEGQRIPYASRVYDDREMTNLVDSALEFWLTSGRYTEEFEKKLGEYLGVRYCCLVNSGSSANLNAFMALTSPLLGERRVKRGDEVITVAAGFPTTVAPLIQYGAVPVFVDVTIPQYNIDVTKLEAIGIHTIGQLAACDLSTLRPHLGEKYARLIHQYANGIDDSPVAPKEPVNKGYGNSVTLPRDVDTFPQACQVLLSLCSVR